MPKEGNIRGIKNKNQREQIQPYQLHQKFLELMKKQETNHMLSTRDTY